MNGIILTGSLFLSLCNMAMMQIVVEKVPLINHKQNETSLEFGGIIFSLLQNSTVKIQYGTCSTIMDLSPVTPTENSTRTGTRSIYDNCSVKKRTPRRQKNPE
ncbi:unnamed protein product [Schistosoma haematobium]|nr:unnamed protein product [Schistosoma haematobium]CAH8559296.1 unnamed protein product [Schistosoma haematobium]